VEGDPGRGGLGVWGGKNGEGVRIEAASSSAAPQD